jgi:hypothetical protein
VFDRLYDETVASASQHKALADKALVDLGELQVGELKGGRERGGAGWHEGLTAQPGVLLRCTTRRLVLHHLLPVRSTNPNISHLAPAVLEVSLLGGFELGFQRALACVSVWKPTVEGGCGWALRGLCGADV